MMMAKVREYSVSIPTAGCVCVTVEAESKADAIAKAWDAMLAEFGALDNETLGGFVKRLHGSV
jgi:predicted trehalose synthase